MNSWYHIHMHTDARVTGNTPPPPLPNIHSTADSDRLVTHQQVLGRDLALFSVVYAFPGTRSSPWVLLMFTAWATSEVIRYEMKECRLIRCAKVFAARTVFRVRAR